MRIWKIKHPITADAMQEVLPKGARFLSLQVPPYEAPGPDPLPESWWMVDPDAPERVKGLQWVGTGQDFDADYGTYLGTVRINPMLVLHLFDLRLTPDGD